MDQLRRTDTLTSTVPRCNLYQFVLVGAFDGKCVPGSPHWIRGHSSHLHAVMGMVTDGTLQNVYEFILHRADNYNNVGGGGLFEHFFVSTNKIILLVFVQLL